MNLNIPKNWKVHIQNQLQIQKQKEQKYFSEFRNKLLFLYNIIFQNLINEYYEYYEIPKEELTSISTPNLLLSEIQNQNLRNLYTGVHITVESKKNDFQFQNKTSTPHTLCDHQYFSSILKFAEILCIFTIASLKTIILDYQPFYDHFGEDFKIKHIQIISNIDQNENIFENLTLHIQSHIRKYILMKNHPIGQFYQHIRPIEIRWMILNSNRFFQLIDENRLDLQIIEKNLHFIRDSSDIELTFLSMIDEISWNNFFINLTSLSFQTLFQRYHILGLSAYTSILELENNFIGNHENNPIQMMMKLLGPFLMNQQDQEDILFQSQFIKSHHMIHAYKMATEGNLKPFLELQLLPPEQEYVLTLIELIGKYYYQLKLELDQKTKINEYQFINYTTYNDNKSDDDHDQKYNKEKNWDLKNTNNLNHSNFLLKKESQHTRLSFSKNVHIPPSFFSIKYYVKIWNLIILPESFGSAWKDLQNAISIAREENISLFSQPYWKEMWLLEAKKPHEDTLNYVQEAYKFQTSLNEKNWYPTYYYSWTYFVIAWIIVVIIFLLFIVAITSYSQHKIRSLNLYISTKKSSEEIESNQT